MMGNKESTTSSSASRNNRQNTTSQCQTDPADILQQSQMEAEQSLAALAKMKERRRAELLAFEQQQHKRLEEEAQVNNKLQANRHKFLNHVAESQKEMEGQIARIYAAQETSRLKFSEDLLKSEAQMEAGIRDVLADIRAHRDQQHTAELVKAEESQSQAILALKLDEFKNLRKADILNEMKKQLEQEIQTSQKTNQTLLTAVAIEDCEKNKQIESILQHRQKDQASLVMALLDEESWQEEAFRSLLSHKDKRTAQLNADIQAVVDQLTELTGWEMHRRARQQDVTTNVLAENRIQLTELLQQLLKQQAQRREDLKKLLEEMEEQRRNQAADYWLVQYQRLMETMPDTLTAPPDKFVPNAPILTDSSPCSAGGIVVNNADDSPSPSAPTSDVFAESLCVVCLDKASQIIFIPCGHLCTCHGCAETVVNCPLCRTLLIQRLRVHL